MQLLLYIAWLGFQRDFGHLEVLYIVSTWLVWARCDRHQFENLPDEYVSSHRADFLTLSTIDLAADRCLGPYRLVLRRTEKPQMKQMHLYSHKPLSYLQQMQQLITRVNNLKKIQNI